MTAQIVTATARQDARAQRVENALLRSNGHPAILAPFDHPRETLR